MKNNIILFCCLVALATVCLARPAEQEEYEYEDEPAPPPKKPTPRPLVGRRNPLAGKNNKATTTTTTTAAPQEEAEPAEGDYVDEEQQPEASSTTEAPKKFIKSGVVRPFRSNDELLATLKRRREQVVSNKLNKPAITQEIKEESASEPVQKETKPSLAAGRRNRFGKPAAKTSDVPASDDATAPSAPARTGRARFSSRS